MRANAGGAVHLAAAGADSQHAVNGSWPAGGRCKRGAAGAAAPRGQCSVGFTPRSSSCSNRGGGSSIGTGASFACRVAQAPALDQHGG